MERGSDVHNPRLDDEMERETESLTRGEPIEARAEDFRAMEDAGDGEPPVQPIITSAEDPVPLTLPHEAVRERSELARHLRGSIFPATRDDVVACAIEEHAPDDMVAALRTLPDDTFLNVEAVWEALGGAREQRTHDDPSVAEPRTIDAADDTADDTTNDTTDDATDDAPGPAADGPVVEEFSFRFDLAHRLAAAPFLVSPGSASVTIDRERGVLVARFGPWRVETSLVNVAYVTSTGPYHAVKTIGPPHLSLADRGLTFATNDREGLCIQFHVPVRGIDPLGLVRHPALTVTVDDVAGLRAALAR